MIKLKNVLKEIGEASAKPFKWEAVNTIDDTLYNIKVEADKTFNKPTSTRIIDAMSYYYHFTSDKTNTKYEVLIELWAGKVTKIPRLGSNKPASKKKYFLEGVAEFSVLNSREDVETNLHEQYRVMATVVDCLKDFITGVEQSEDFQLKELHIFPKADTTDKISSIDSKRGHMYKLYIQKQLKTIPYKAAVSNISDEGFKITFAH